MKTDEPFLSELAPVRRALGTWRQSRQPRQPIPERLWGRMAVLGRRHGVSRICHALRLDYNALKRRVVESADAPDFVDVEFAPALDQSPGCTAQLEDGKGGKLLHATTARASARRFAAVSFQGNMGDLRQCGVASLLRGGQ